MRLIAVAAALYGLTAAAALLAVAYGHAAYEQAEMP